MVVIWAILSCDGTAVLVAPVVDATTRRASACKLRNVL